jgi:hypothetical protein
VPIAVGGTALIALVAAYVSARLAMRGEPIIALRSE